MRISQLNHLMERHVNNLYEEISKLRKEMSQGEERIMHHIEKNDLIKRVISLQDENIDLKHK